MPNAFLHILGEDITAEENTVSIQEREITKLANKLPDRANTTVSKDLLTKKARLWQAQLEVIGDFLLPGPGVWWHWKGDGSVEFHDGPSEATHHPEGPRVFHFRSSSVKAIQTSLETAWKQCSEKPKEMPLYQLRSKSEQLVYNKLHGNDDSPLAAEECQPAETDPSTKPQEPSCEDIDNSDDMEVAAVIFREELQLENLHDHLQSDKEQGKEHQPQENSKEPLEQDQLPQLSEHETCSRSDEGNQPLTSKTAKAAEVVLGKTPVVIQLEKLRNNLNRNPKFRYCASRYENHLAKIQVLVLKATKQLNNLI